MPAIEDPEQKAMETHGVWRRLKAVFRRQAIARSGRAPSGPQIAAAPDGSERGGRGVARQPLFRASDRYPHIFAFSPETLDLDMRIPFLGGRDAERDAILLFVFGYEDTFGAPHVNEAYVCRKIGSMAPDHEPGADATFDFALAGAGRSDLRGVIAACVAGGDLERMSQAGGGDIGLTPAGRDYAAGLAFDLDRDATRRRPARQP